jgi:uncharacterized membrane protein
METNTWNTPTYFVQTPVQPGRCLEQGWALIRDRYWLFLGITVVGMLIGSALPLVLMGPMMCGIYLCYFRKIRGEEIPFETLFRGFDHFVEALIATLVIMGASFLVIFPTIMAGIGIMFFGIFNLTQSQSESGGLLMAGSFLLFFFLIFAVSLAVGVVFLFAYPLIVDRGLSGWEAVKTSARAIWANLGGMLGLVLLQSLLSLAGLCFCYVGAFLVMPVVVGATVTAYRKIFPVLPAGASDPLPNQG